MISVDVFGRGLWLAPYALRARLFHTPRKYKQEMQR